MIRRDDFSALEREALQAWTPDAPPRGFADRVLAHAGVSVTPIDRGAPRLSPWAPARGLTFAAVAVLLIGGLWLVRGSIDGRRSTPAAGDPERAAWPAMSDPDGGARPETAEAPSRADRTSSDEQAS